MKTNIYLVRHAHSTYTPDELSRPLSVEGKQEAIRVASKLQNEKIDLVYASPYKRAMETVQGIADNIGKSILVEEGFKERTLAESPVENFKLAIRKVWEDYDFRYDGGESNHMAQERGIQALLKVLEKHEGKNIVVGTHGNLMVLMMNYFNHAYDFKFWQELEMPDIYKLSFEQDRLIHVKRIWL
ncbi:histidine phosphatase family protein [Paucisalibacillus sp. EB02]|uniref:histidine phosphatase family protein n=1 Tax=Paucisalibacillus sp. EB02 TaxID=1347087 RepID=UPI0005AB8E85|nr:histidine phosphatase family protein [Paucisalibacillus sp. EB02]